MTSGAAKIVYDVCKGILFKHYLKPCLDENEKIWFWNKIYSMREIMVRAESERFEEF